MQGPLMQPRMRGMEILGRVDYEQEDEEGEELALLLMNEVDHSEQRQQEPWETENWSPAEGNSSRPTGTRIRGFASRWKWAISDTISSLRKASNSCMNLKLFGGDHHTLGNDFEEVWNKAGNMEIGEADDDFGTIDWALYKMKARTHSIAVQRQIQSWPLPGQMVYKAYEAAQSWIALGFIGVACGVAAAIIDVGTDWATDLKFGYCSRGLWINRAICCNTATSADMQSCPGWNDWSGWSFLSGISYIAIAMAMAAFSVWLNRLSPYASGSGIPEAKVILGGFTINKFLDAWTLAAKALGLILAVGSGLSIGKEGPFIHVMLCISNLCTPLFSKFRHNEGRKRELLSCAAAAGVGVAFGAPIGGVLFSLEEISSYFPPKTMWRCFWCTISAILTMERLNPRRSGKLVMFEVEYHHQWQWFEMAPFLFLGVMGGVIGAIFNRSHTSLLCARQGWAASRNPMMETLAVCAITSVIHYQIVYLQGSTTGLLGALFADCTKQRTGVHQALCRDSDTVIRELLFAAVVKLVFTIYTCTIPVPGGILIPSLAIGGMLGRAVGLEMQYLVNHFNHDHAFAECKDTATCVTPGVYAIVGAAAVLGGVSRTTVSLVVIMFEITGGLEYVLPVMTAVMVSKWVGDAFGKDSIYDEVIALREYPYLDNKAELPYTEKKARDIMTTSKLEVLGLQGNTIPSLKGVLGRTGCQGFPVVTDPNEMIVVGYITRRILQGTVDMVDESSSNGRSLIDAEDAAPIAPINSEMDLRPWFDLTPVQVDEQTPLDRVLDMFFALGLRYMLVTRLGRLVGIITKKDLLVHVRKFNH